MGDVFLPVAVQVEDDGSDSSVGNEKDNVAGPSGSRLNLGWGDADAGVS